MRTLPSIGLFVLLLGGALLGGVLGLRYDVHPALLIPLVTVVSAGAVLLTQRLWPFNLSWREYADAIRVDTLHALFSTGAATTLVELVLLGWLVSVSAGLSAHIGFDTWPTAWPLVAQMVLALVIAEFGAYWVHRLAHRWPAMWRIHALHHSSDRLYALNSARNHPLNVIIAYSASLGPVVLLGASTEVLVLLTLFTSVHGLIQHSNLDLRLGWLDWVFASPALHRRHHHIEEARSNSNFGSTLVLWDIVFGTRVLPAGEVNDAVGLPDMAFRTNFWSHLASPFQLGRLTRVVEATEAAARDATDAACAAGRRVIDVTNEFAGAEPRLAEASASGHYMIHRE